MKNELKKKRELFLFDYDWALQWVVEPREPGVLLDT
jgi:hypothetical protein